MTRIEKSCFGATAEGEEVSVYTLSNGKVQVSVISWGATITSVKVGGVDVVLGFEDMAGYTSTPPKGKNPYMGAVVGRVANRIAEGKFRLDGVEYSLAKVCLSYQQPGDLSLVIRTTDPTLYTEDSWGWTRSTGGRPSPRRPAP